MKIVNWLESQKLDYEFVEEKIFKLDEEYYLALDPADKIISNDFTVLPSEEEFHILETTEFPINKVAFYFGQNWYWTSIDGETKLNPLRHIGSIKTENHFPEYYPFLGVHGKFELLNGNRDYKDWVRKAKFLGITALGIAEAQTLAGTMLFQEICQAEGIKSILGQTAYVKNKDGFYWAKFFVKNKVGWRNILKINKAQLVDNWEEKFVGEDVVMKHSEGLVVILNPSVELKPWLVNKYKKYFNDVYFQIDLTKWEGVSKDIEWLSNVQVYLNKFLDVLKPVRFDDAYYLDSIDAPVKKALNQIGKVSNQHLSSDQHFKDLDELTETDRSLFSPSEKADQVMNAAIRNACEIAELCDYQIPTKNRYLPKYIMNSDEKESFKDNGHLFHFKVLKGFEEKVFPSIKDDQSKIDQYLDRIDEETKILEKGDVIDYFLIANDLNQWCFKNGILVGHGRGSVGGSLIAYLMDISQVDPIKYGLLFSRFLTEGRLKGSLPDADIDYSDRDKVVQYMRQKYGKDFVASVCTYGNMKVKNAIKDFSRINGVNAGEANKITSFIRKDYEASDFTKFFELVSNDSKIRYFVKSKSNVFKYFDLILHQTRTASIHACATIIVPTEDDQGESVNIHDLIPTKIMDGQLVTEWEGPQLEKAGFLKEDILGLKQLEKFDGIISLIEKNHDKKIDIYSIDLEDKKVFERFQDGLNEDVFQFGTNGLKSYCKALKPDSILELAAANSLYRPGAMESNAHTDYVKIKHGHKEPEYEFLLEEITQETNSIMAYQEQIMKAYSLITDSNLEDADKFRKYVTKAYKLKAKGIKDTEYEKYEKVFIEKYIEKGQNRKDAERVWEKLQNFASYSFNKSHAVAYSIIGYISQWFKVYYPLEFWSVSLNLANDDERPSRISEIEMSESINIKPVDVNFSELEFIASEQDWSIYWSLSSVKWLGEKAATIIIEERHKNGKFFSIKEFLERLPKRNINKRAVTNLILSGGFDQMFLVEKETDRHTILEEYYKLIDSQQDLDKFAPYVTNNIFWQITQYELTGFGGISYDKLVSSNGFNNFQKSVQQIELEKEVSVSGMVQELKIKNSPKAGEFAIIEINTNNELNSVLIWNDIFEKYRDLIINCKEKILILNGTVKYDSYAGKNCIQSNRKTKLVTI